MPVPPEARLNITIVGAGLAGLGAAISTAEAGHKVRVLEQSKELVEIGAGLQITPNGSRLLQHWRLPDSFWATAAAPTTLTIHRYPGEVLNHAPTFGADMRAKYGAPFIDSHRADLQRALHARAVEAGAQFVFGVRAQGLRLSGKPAVITTTAGQRAECDLVVAADGLWSSCREAFLAGGTRAEPEPPKPTGDLAYRIVLGLEEVRDEELRGWIRNPTVHIWGSLDMIKMVLLFTSDMLANPDNDSGPRSHVVFYSLKGGTTCNIVLIVPDDLPADVSREPASTEQMRKLFEGWDPILTRFLSFVTKVDKWKLMHRDEMKSWVGDESNIVFMGDACHSMLPYLAQGANSSLEDAAVLGTLLGRLTSKDQLPAVLRTFERLRKERGEAIVRETFKQRDAFHMVDGPEQEARDEILRAGPGEGPNSAPFPSRWTCPKVQPWLYGYDAVKDAQDAVISLK